MQRQWQTSTGEMSEELRAALGAGEEVILHQRSMTGESMFSRGCSWIVGIGLILAAIGLAMEAQGASNSSGESAFNMFCCMGSLGVAAFVWPLFIPKHEYVVTKTRLIIGTKQWGRFNYDVVPIDMISGVKVTSAFGSGSGVEIQRAGGNLKLPVLGGGSGQQMALTITKLLEERRTHSAQSQAAMRTPVPMPPPSSPPMTKQARLTALRDRLLQGQISEATYNMLRKEIENE